MWHRAYSQTHILSHPEILVNVNEELIHEGQNQGSHDLLAQGDNISATVLCAQANLRR